LTQSGADATLLNDKDETPEQALLSAMADKQAKIAKDLEAQAMKDSFDEANLPNLNEPCSKQPRRPSESKPDGVSRPAPHTTEANAQVVSGGAGGEDTVSDLPCVPARKLDFAQRLDAQFGIRRHTSSRLATSEKPAPSDDIKGNVRDIHLTIADVG
jgi:hypothetical protein